jgi:hypothetical protein
MTQPPQERELRATAAIVAVFTAGFVMAFRPVADMDFHWHLAHGRAYLAGELPADRDPFTHLPTVTAPAMQGWAADVTFALAERVGGVTAVKILLATMVGLAGVAVLRLGGRWSGSAWGAALALGFFASTAALRLRARPEIFSLAAPFLLLVALDGPPRPRQLVTIFLLCAAWVNLHAGAVVAPALAGTTMLGSGWLKRLPATLAATAGICVHPEGPAFLWSFARETAALAPLIPEWQPLWQLPPMEFVPEWMAVAVAAIAIGAAARHWRAAGVGRLALALVGVVLAAQAIRFLYYLTLVILTTLGARRDIFAAGLEQWRGRIAAATLILFLYPGSNLLNDTFAYRAAGLSPFSEIYTPHFPIEAARFLANTDLRGKLYHPASWGGYLASELHPRYRTAHDGRVNLYAPALAAELTRFEDPATRRSLVERLGLEILVLPRGGLPREEWVDAAHPEDAWRRWLPVHIDTTAIVFVDVRGENWAHNRRALERRH